MAEAQRQISLGPGMNAAFMNRFLAPNSLYQSMIMKNINHGVL